MITQVQIEKTFYPHFVLIINNKRLFRCVFTETDRDKCYIWMEGYLQGLADSDVQFDDVTEADNELPILIMWY